MSLAEKIMNTDVEAGSKWRSLDPREKGRRVIVVEATDEHIYLRRYKDGPLAGPYGRRSRVSRQQFFGRFAPEGGKSCL